ncbi:hypothetical protein ANAEL_01352 [Anaerolineales bacterium]|nr:hypothetical protein ANAEL_01352 [Anaerolineales bacterium]
MLKFFNFRMFIAWALSIPAVFLAIGFLDNFYATFFEVIVLTLLIQLVAGSLIYRLLGKAKRLRIDQPLDLLLALVLFLTLTVFILSMFGMARQFPRLFDKEYFILNNGLTIPFILGNLLSIPCLAWGRKIVKTRDVKSSRAYRLMNDTVTGILLAGFFFIVYLMLVSIFNQPAFDVDDIFFDSDGLLWRMRFTTDTYRDYYWRSVHPFVLLIIRPLVWLTSLLLKGDKLYAAFVLVAFAGALCVFLAWYFVKHTTGNSMYALLIASLLGASAAHLVFGSLIETYIFLAAIMLVFLALLLKDKPLISLVVTGLLSFGITITNFAQTAIAFILVKRDFKQWLKYGLIVGALVIPMALLNNLVYPDSQPYFFIPTNLTVETDNTFSPSIARGGAILRVMFLHSIVAPDPLILEEEIPFLKVWIFKASPMRLSEYNTIFGTTLALVWLGLLLVGGVFFLKNLKKQDNRFTFAFILILVFNFILHLRYGKDIFLYSTNWTYALVLFLGLAWRELADKRWFQIILLVFLALLLANNSRLILTMLNTSALHLK